ncbi:MAG: dipeptide epimerase [bacterium]|nr:dipeptide epimerase [bacterium]
MKIRHVDTWKSDVELSRPYTIATRTITAVELFFVRIRADDGTVGVGSASPGEGVTGESPAACAAALEDDRLGWLAGRDPRHLGALCRELKTTARATPAARAAVDMALHDLFARYLGVPLVDVLGRRHQTLPTSITVGIKSTEEALSETEEYLGRGFRCLKIKVGLDLDEDLERLAKLRELAGGEVTIRVDANQGYGAEQALRFYRATEHLDLELIEQPLPAASDDDARGLPADLRRKVAADESLITEENAFALAREPAACGIFNIKLMKCGGVSSALAIAQIAEAAGIELMWGCMDESAISIAAAVHAAYACPTTRYLDLDGSFDLARDPATGGFAVEGGMMRILEEPGLGATLGTD